MHEVEASERRDRPVDELLHVGLRDDVAGRGDGFPARPLDLGDRFAQPLLVAIVQGHARARARERERSRASEARSGAGDRRDLAVERRGRHARSVEATAASRSSSEGSTSRSSEAAYGIGVSFAVTRSGVERSRSIGT